MPRIETYSSSPNQLTQRTQASDFADTSGINSMQSALGGASQLLKRVQIQKDTLDYTRRSSDLHLQLMKDAEVINNSDLPEGETISSMYEKNFKEKTSAFYIPSSIRNQVELDLERMRASFSEGGVREEARQAGVRARSDWEQSLINAQNIVSLDPNMAGAMQEKLQAASASLNIPDAERDALFVDGQRRILGAQAGAIAKADPAAFISQAKAGKWSNVPNLEAYVNKAENRIKQIENESAVDINTETNNIISGLPSSPEVDARIQKYANSGSGKVSAAYQTYQVVKTDVSSYKEMSPFEIASEINQRLIPEAHKDGATPLERQRLDIAQKYLRNAASNISSDTISYAVQNGVLPDGVQTLDINAPSSFISRVGAMEAAGEKYGYSTFTTTEERQELSTQFSSLDPKGKVAFLGKIRSSVGDYAGKVISEISKDHSLEMEYVGGMVAADKSFDRTASLAISGMRLMELDPSKKPQSKYKQENLLFGDQIKALDVDTQVAMRNTAAAIYVGLGGDNEITDSDLAAKAVHMTLGGIEGQDNTGVYEINGETTYLPPSINGNVFQSFVDRLGQDDLSRMGVEKAYDRFGEVSTYDLKNNSSLLMVGSTGNAYVYELINSNDGLPFLNQNGQPAQITFSKQDISDVIFRRLE